MKTKSRLGDFKRFFSKFKKFVDSEKEAQVQKKKAKNNSVKPRGFIARKAGVVTFWLLFGFMFLVVVVTVFNSDSTKAINNDAVEVEKNYAASSEGIEYAKNFANQYFTWNISSEGKELRKQNLARFLASGLDLQAGLDFNGLEWNSSYKGAELKKVEEKGDNLAHITLLVHASLNQNGSDKVEQTQKYFVVPVAYDGKTFGIYELPKYTYFYEDTTIKEVKNTQLKQANVTETSEIKKFLTTFFKSYAEDSKDQLDYILTNPKITDGLNKSMLFKEVNKSSFYKGEKENTFIVFTEVTLLEPVTNVPLKSNYQLSIVKKDDKYMVSGIDDIGNKEIITKGPEDVKKEPEKEVTEENKQQEAVQSSIN